MKKPNNFLILVYALCTRGKLKKEKEKKKASKNPCYLLQNNNQNALEGPLIICIFFCLEIEKEEKNLQIIAQSLTQSGTTSVADI